MLDDMVWETDGFSRRDFFLLAVETQTHDPICYLDGQTVCAFLGELVKERHIDIHALASLLRTWRLREAERVGLGGRRGGPRLPAWAPASRPSKEVRERNDRLWREAQDWTALVKLNEDFLMDSWCGRQDISTPYCYGPFPPIMMELMESLLQLHEYRILTIGAQPGYTSAPLNESGNVYSQYRLIPYVDFLIPFEGAVTQNFCEALIRDGRLMTSITDFCPEPSAFWPGSHDAALTAYERRAASRNELREEGWVGTHSLPKQPIPRHETFFNEVTAAKQDLIWCVLCLNHDADVVKLDDKAFMEAMKRTDVLHLVIEHARKAGLKRS
jgi:hypothetical protein